MTSVLIIGLGQYGKYVAKHMEQLHCEVMVVDTNEAAIDEIRPYVTNALIGDGTNEAVLRSLGVNNFDVCIVAIGNSFQSSLQATYLLKELGARQVVSLATNDIQMEFLLRNGADEVVHPEKQMAIRVATKYASETILDFIQLDNNYSIYEMKVPKEWFGKTLAQIDIRKKFGVNILTLKRNDEVFIPSADTCFMVDDIAFVIGEQKSVYKCFKI
ncbi:MAG: TrkA family potassium uptake protein [Oscillospiraceae bacterium]|nr:TrkA family potassium uptake protein [Oscillospiraceae bacterium]